MLGNTIIGFAALCLVPHAAEPEAGEHDLFHIQRYGQDAQTSVYQSGHPFNFGGILHLATEAP